MCARTTTARDGLVYGLHGEEELHEAHLGGACGEQFGDGGCADELRVHVGPYDEHEAEYRQWTAVYGKVGVANLRSFCTARPR